MVEDYIRLKDPSTRFDPKHPHTPIHANILNPWEILLNRPTHPHTPIIANILNPNFRKRY